MKSKNPSERVEKRPTGPRTQRLDWPHVTILDQARLLTDHLGHHWRMVSLLPIEGWWARYEGYTVPVVALALLECVEYGSGFKTPSDLFVQKTCALVQPPGWAGGPAPHWVFASELPDARNHQYGRFVEMTRTAPQAEKRSIGLSLRASEGDAA